jgi:hypothetical protein
LEFEEMDMGSHEVGGDAPLPGDTQVIYLSQEEMITDTSFQVRIEDLLAKMPPSMWTK